MFKILKKWKERNETEAYYKEKATRMLDRFLELQQSLNLDYGLTEVEYKFVLEAVGRDHDIYFKGLHEELEPQGTAWVVFQLVQAALAHRQNAVTTSYAAYIKGLNLTVSSDLYATDDQKIVQFGQWQTYPNSESLKELHQHIYTLAVQKLNGDTLPEDYKNQVSTLQQELEQLMTRSQQQQIIEPGFAQLLLTLGADSLLDMDYLLHDSEHLSFPVYSLGSVQHAQEGTQEELQAEVHAAQAKAHAQGLSLEDVFKMLTENLKKELKA